MTKERRSSLFRSVDRRRRLTAQPMARTDVLRMFKRRAKAVARFLQNTGRAKPTSSSTWRMNSSKLLRI